MSHLSLKYPLLTALVMGSAHNAFAAIAQEPLLNRPNTVSPNLTLILDTSGSMDGNYIYQYGNIHASGMGPLGPKGDDNPDDKCTSDDRAFCSPDVNRLYYDPRIRYLPRVNYQGNYLEANAPTTGDDAWRVYFRNMALATVACPSPSGAYTTGTLVTLDCYHNPYTPPAALLAAGATVISYPIISANVNYPKFLKRSDCVASATHCTYTEEGQNHSNWKKWYSTRGLMAATGIGSAFQPLKADAIRLGWSTIKNLNSDSVLDRGVSSFDAGTSAGGTKNLFFTWLYGRTFTGGTPNLPAVNKIGQYYERTDSDGPWSSIPDPASTGITTVTTAVGPGKTELPANHLSCRRSYSMLITDGYSNSGIPTTAGNSDNTGFSILPAVGTAFTYTPAAPYNDAASNTMADIAMHYWGRDLRSLANRVPRISSTRGDNPSTWQNVSFYAVTLGIDGTLPQTTATIANIKAGTPWPTPVESKPTTIDDIWHATINGRGELLNASNGSELTTGLNRMFETIAGSPQTLSGVAVSTTFLKNGTRKYKPQYTPGTWSGNLSAIKLDPTTGNDLYPPITFWQVERGVDVNGDPISLIPAAASRNIVTWTGTLAATFNTTNTGLSADIVNYVRGDPAKEQRKSGGTYRNRTAKLGDIVNSGPAYILDNVDLNYEKLGFTNYRSFVATKAARTEGVLFVGANDGMLHAFRNSTGAEIFAFVPKAVWPKLNKLTEPSTTVGYAHQYYVDGPNTETDAYLDGNWANVLLGTTGAGAKAVYALNVTNPTSMNASKVLWEVNSSSTGFTNLGHVLSDVQAGKVEAVGALANDDWVAVFGNGFDSSTGVASLFVVNLKTGALLKEIVADSAGANGLGGVRLVRDATQQVIGAYAGDLKGNLWKFDLKGTDKANWKVGLSGPLYAAGSTRAITATPAIVAHPNGGYVVAFGTGKFMETTDTSAPFVTQRMYGIWDKQPFGATSVVAGDAVTGDTALQQQTITTVTISSIKYYAVSTNPVAWGDGLSTGKRGWYINLPNSGQRVANPLERLFEKSGGTFVIASTISPVSSAAPDLCVQSGSGSGWVYLIDGLTGSGSTLPTLDTNGNGVIDSLDAIVSGFQDAVDGLPKAITTGSDTGCIVTAQDTCVKFKLQCGQVGQPACPPPGTPGSLTIKKREWRQLFMR